mgnify:FL=1
MESEAYIATPIKAPTLGEMVEHAMKRKGIKSGKEAARALFGDSKYYDQWLRENEQK